MFRVNFSVQAWSVYSLKMVICWCFSTLILSRALTYAPIFILMPFSSASLLGFNISLQAMLLVDSTT